MCSACACNYVSMFVCVAPNVGMCVGVVGQECCMGGMIVQPLVCGYMWVWLIVWLPLGSLADGWKVGWSSRCL